MTTWSPMETKSRILIVDDEPIIAMLLEDMAIEFGYDVVATATTVVQALACIAQEPRLDAALLDVQLGGERSYAVADALMARGVPFALITGYGPDILKGFPYMGIPVLTKPFRTEALQALFVLLLHPVVEGA